MLIQHTTVRPHTMHYGKIFEDNSFSISCKSLDTACLTGDKDPPGIFQGAWKYPGSWNFPGGLEISRT